MTQVKPFNEALGGTTKYLCLSNVRKGYSIPALHEYAKQDWDNNVQHKDRNFPSGCSVPVYWSWTGKVDGVTKDWGHIAVRLADGRIWTDGRYYANVDTLNANYLSGKGTYLGWGELVNKVRIVQSTGGSMAGIPDADNYYGRYNKLMLQVRGRNMTRDEFRKNIVGVSDLTAVERISDNPESDRATEAQQWALANRASVEKRIVDLQKMVETQSAQIIGLNQTIKDKQLVIDDLKGQVASLRKENDQLRAQLAAAGSNEDTELLNNFGSLLAKLIARLGLKK